MNYPTDEKLYDDIRKRLRSTGESVYQRYPNLLDPPGIRSAGACAQQLLNLFPDASSILVERHAGLRPVREAVLHAGRTLLVPDTSGSTVYHIPPDAIGSDGVLRIQPLPKCAVPYTGAVDLVALGCYAFTPGESYLWDLGAEKNAWRFERMEDGLDNGFVLPDTVIRVAIAADCQELEPGEWPEEKRSLHMRVHAVVTPTRVIDMHTGESELLGSPDRSDAGFSEKRSVSLKGIPR